MRHKISIITIVFNDLQGFLKTYDSLESQTFKDFEWIVVDGGSTDGLPEKLPEIDIISQYISEPDEGIANAFNKGSVLANGELCLFLNAGDSLFQEDTLQQAITKIGQLKLSKIEESIIYGNFECHSVHGIKQFFADHNRLWKTNPLNHQSVFIGLQILRKIKYDERLLLGMDYDFWLQCLGRYPFHKIELFISVFSGDGISGSPSWMLHNQIIREFLRGINRKRKLNLGDVYHLFWKAHKRKAATVIHRLRRTKTYLNIKSLFRKT